MELLGLLLAAAVFSLIGVALGTFTGLTPGVHVNTIAVFILSAQTAIIGFTATTASFFGASSSHVLLLASTVIVTMAITHTFLDIIPTVFLGVPDDDTALNVLPGHKLVKMGKGEEAVKYSAMGSFGALILGLAAVLPARYLMGTPTDGYEKLLPMIPFMLIGVETILIIMEKASPEKTLAWNGKMVPGTLDHLKQRAWAAALFLISGALGYVVMNGALETHNPLIFPSLYAGLLFPIFTGLFGLPGLLMSLSEGEKIPPQHRGIKHRLGKKKTIKGVIAGTFAGGLVGWFPGVSSASATVIAKGILGEEIDEKIPETEGEDEWRGDDEKEFIVAVSGVNTANAIMNLVALFVILKARSGAMGAVKKLLGGDISVWKPISDVPLALVVLLFGSFIAGVCGYFLTTRLGSVFSSRYADMNYVLLSKALIVLLVVAVAVLSGPVGLVILGVSTLLGLIPPMVGVQRAHLMGCIMLPVVVYFV